MADEKEKDSDDKIIDLLAQRIKAGSLDFYTLTRLWDAAMREAKK